MIAPVVYVHLYSLVVYSHSTHLGVNTCNFMLTSYSRELSILIRISTLLFTVYIFVLTSHPIVHPTSLPHHTTSPLYHLMVPRCTSIDPIITCLLSRIHSLSLPRTVVCQPRLSRVTATRGMSSEQPQQLYIHTRQALFNCITEHDDVGTNRHDVGQIQYSESNCDHARSDEVLSSNSSKYCIPLIIRPSQSSSSSLLIHTELN